MDRIYALNRLGKGKTLDFFRGVFESSGSKVLLRNYSEITANKESSAQAEKEIRDSDSLVLILDSGIMGDDQARQWFYWATGCAQCRDVWVLQDYADLGTIMVPFYRYQHHVVYCETPAWADYLAGILRDRHALAAASPLLSGIRSRALEGGLENYFGPSAGFPRADVIVSRPVRFFTSCQLYKTPYILHMPEALEVTRCLDCHRFYALQSTREFSTHPTKA